MRINNKIVLAGLIAVNLILWPLFIIPGIIGLIHSGRQNNGALDFSSRDNGSLPDLVPVYGDLLKTRDPFNFLNFPMRVNPVNTGNKNINLRGQPTEPPKNVSADTFKSKFRLKSIVQSKNVYTATLEEAPNYGNVQNPVAPYSYRFGSQPDAPETKSYIVSEGDVLQDEKVLIIKENFIILSRNGQFFKLTFSGGSPVAHP